MPDADGMPTEAEWLEGRYPGAQEQHEAEIQALTCDCCGAERADISYYDEPADADLCPPCAAVLDEEQKRNG